jgi:nitronate monooxygenase
MNSGSAAFERARAFAGQWGLGAPILLAPMAGACPPSLSIAVVRAGGLGACGALTMAPDAIDAWAADLREATGGGAFQMNLWVPEPAPARDAAAESAVVAFLSRWGPAVAPNAGAAQLIDFDAQCEAVLRARPAVISSIMGLFPPPFVARMKAAGIAWLATATTVAEARAAEAAGADAIVAQGMEAGGHRGSFEGAAAEATMVGLFSLLPAVVDAVKVPVVAAGGVADARAVAAALVLGASAVEIGTGFLRCPEAKLPRSWADALGRASPEDTRVTRAFSGRAGRSLATPYVQAAAAADAPPPAPYPVQRGLTQAMRKAATAHDDIDRMQAWAGQSAARAPARPAGEVLRDLWEGAGAILSG